MTDADSQASPDDTVEMSLTDRLLTPSAPAPAASSAYAAPSPENEWESDGDEFQPIDRTRSRWTTALGVALIFMLGVLGGALLTHAVSPQPAPRVVYVLSDPTSASPLPEASPSLTPSRR